MQPRMTPLNAERKEWAPQELLGRWQHHLQEHDLRRVPSKKGRYALLAWYEREEQALLQLSPLTPTALIGYRNHLQHEQHKSISTINLQVSALRTWRGRLTEQRYPATDPAAHVKLVCGEAFSSRKVLKSAQVKALLRQA